VSDDLLNRLQEGGDLSPTQVRGLVARLVDASTSDEVRAALLLALRRKGETPDEIAAFAREMRRRAVPFRAPGSRAALDLCGTGGAVSPRFNVSTVSAFVVAAAGVPVAKHGNRSARGHAGSSDLLEALGLPVTRSRAFAEASFRTTRLAFLHAPLYHPATRAVVAARRSVGGSTVFNLLGPLTNPARPRHQIVGAPDLGRARLFAQVLPRLAVASGAALVGDSGADEFSPRGTTRIFVWNGAPAVRQRRVEAERLLLPEERRGDWAALPAEAAAREARRILAGGPGANRGSVLLTSGAALWVAGRVDSHREGVERARDVLDSGEAMERLERLGALASSRAWPPEH
jgi:anthranilate phosphoribosyltransferase